MVVDTDEQMLVLTFNILLEALHDSRGQCDWVVVIKAGDDRSLGN